MVKITIEINNITSQIVDFVGDDLSLALKEALSYSVTGAVFSEYAKAGMWDGTKNLYDAKHQVFPTGLLRRALSVIKACGYDFNLVDKREKPMGFPLILKNVKLRDYQQECVTEMVSKTRGLIQVGTSGGKCFRYGTEVLMYDGTKKPIESLKIGDKVMGIDSKPRTVESIHYGREPLYEIALKGGASYYVTGNHVLTGKITNLSNKRKRIVIDCNGNRYGSGDVVDISVNNWLKSSNMFKHCFKLFYKGVDTFENTTDNLPMDPYTLGLWIGDGSSDCMAITTMDTEVRDHWYSLLKDNLHMNVYTRTVNGRLSKASTYRICAQNGVKLGNPYMNVLKELNLLNNKHIPNIYKYSSYKSRAALLAGLLDSDGYSCNGGHDICQKSKQLAEDIAFVTRSLGLYTSVREKIAKCQTGVVGKYYRLHIGGNFSKIPFKIQRRCVKEHKKYNSEQRLFGFTVSLSEVDNYCGFSIKEEDKHFLLGDFLVAHNSAITAGVVANIGVNTLVIVPTRELLKQTSQNLSNYLGIKVGIIGDGEKDIGKVTVATFQSLTTSKEIKKRKFDNKDKRWKTIKGSEVVIREDLKDYLNSVECIYCDECHKLSSMSLQQIYNACPNAYYRYGCSATPFHNKDEDMLIYAITGRVLKEFSASWLISNKWISRPIIHLVPFKQERLLGGIAYNTAYEERITNNEKRNNLIKQLIEKEADLNHSVLVSVRIIKHGQILYDLLKDKYKDKIVFLNSKVSSETVTQTLKALSNKDIKVVIGTSMLQEGINIPSLNTLIFASCPKSTIVCKQLVGRVLRKTEDKDIVDVFDIQDYGCKFFTSASKERVEIYRTEPEFVLQEDNNYDISENLL